MAPVNFDWSAIFAPVPADTTFLALGMASGEELVLNLNKAIVNPVNAEPAALLSLTIESAQGLPAGRYTDQPALGHEPIVRPLTAPTEVTCFSSCFLQRASLCRVVAWSRTWCSPTDPGWPRHRHRRPNLECTAITLFNPAADRRRSGARQHMLGKGRGVQPVGPTRARRSVLGRTGSQRWTYPPCPRASRQVNHSWTTARREVHGRAVSVGA